MSNNKGAQTRGRGPRRPFPRHTVEKALEIATAIQNKNNGNPWKPMYIAEAVGYSPDSSGYRYLLSSSYNYGFTKGSYKSEFIELTPLGVKVTKPRNPTERVQGLIDSVMNINLFKDIYENYKDGVFPARDSFFRNMLERDYNVPIKWVDEAIDLLEANGKYVGIIRTVAGKSRVVFDVTPTVDQIDTTEEEEYEEKDEELPVDKHLNEIPVERKIFIAHGKNKLPLDQLRKILDQFKVLYVVALDEPHSGRPISQKVAELMRECTSAIFIFTADEACKTSEDEITYRPSDNVVYELGAASILYQKNIVIFKEKDVKFASDFSDIGYITFEKDNLEAKALDLLKELVGFGLLKVTVA